MPNAVDFGLAVPSSVVLQDSEYRPTDVNILKSYRLQQHSHKSSYHRQSSLIPNPGGPWRQPYRRSGLATLRSVGAVA